jgi:hypothetical protein
LNFLSQLPQQYGWLTRYFSGKYCKYQQQCTHPLSTSIICPSQCKSLYNT